MSLIRSRYTRTCGTWERAVGLIRGSGIVGVWEHERSAMDRIGYDVSVYAVRFKDVLIGQDLCWGPFGDNAAMR